MKKLIACLLLILCCAFVQAQENRMIRGQVIDASTKRPLPKATVTGKEKEIVSITDHEGKFSMMCKDCKDSSLQITISFIGYEAKNITVNLSETREILIRLKPTDTKLGELTINPDLMKYIFFGSHETQVLDYVFFQSGWLIALYNFHEDKTYLVYLGKSKNVVFEKEFPNKNFQNFFVSCNNRYYAEAGNEVVEIVITLSGIEYKPVDFKFFNKAIKYYVGTKGKYFYITQFNLHYLVQGFFLDDTELKKIDEHPFTTVIREKDIQLLKDAAWREFAYKMLEPKSTFHPVDPEGIEGGWYSNGYNYMREEFKERDAQTYTLKEEFAPFYVLDSSLILINYFQNHIERHSFNGKLMDTVSLKINNEKRESRQTFYDTFSKKIFYRSEDADTAQSIDELNVSSGVGKEVRKISRNEIYNVKVSNGYVYYLFNPLKTNNVFLFREKFDE